MANLDEETLFSLELAVEEVSIHHNIPCRFPSIAFRLLDFPTLVIHHVNVELTRTIRLKIQLEPRYRAPLQFHELQDSSGKFPVRRGKSCLFRVSPNTLQAHLCNAPLYVMVMDTYPEVPKLIASCSVPLDSAMNTLYDSICSHGSSVPTVSVERGTYEVFNLMGKQLGHVTLAVRLLSLGSALLHHLPDNAVTHIVKQSTGEDLRTSENVAHINKIPKQNGAVATEAAALQKQEAWIEREEDMQTEERMRTAVDAVIRNSTRGTSSSEIPIDITPSVDNITTQTDRKRLETIATQTVRKKTVVSNQAVTQTKIATNKKELEADLIVTNVDCPPPLFYNSKYDDPERDTPAYGPYEARTGPYQTYNRNDSDNVSSDDETIRTEDVYSDTDLPDSGFLQRKHIRAVKDMPDGEGGTADTGIVKQRKDLTTDPVMKPASVGADLTQFPILKALMSEIMKIQGVDVIKDGVRFATDSKLPASGRRPDSASSKKGFQPSGRTSVRPSGPGKPSAGNIRMKNVYFSGHTGSAAAKSKSWFGDQRLFVASPANIKKSPISVAMTRTQRLRLRQTNPQLLAKLEGCENERVKEFHQHERIVRQQKYPQARLVEMESGQKAADARVKAVEGTEKSPQRRKPVPTPRASIVSGTREAEDAQRFNERRAANESVLDFADENQMLRDDQLLKTPKTSGTNVQNGGQGKPYGKVLSSTYKIDQRDDRTDDVQFSQHVDFNNDTATMNVTQMPETTLLADRAALDLRIKDIVFKQVSQILAGNIKPVPREEPKKTEVAQQSKSALSLVLPSPRIHSASGGFTDRTQFEYSDDFEDPATATNRGADDEDDFDLSHLRKVVEKYSDSEEESHGRPMSSHNVEKDAELERYVEQYPSDSEEEDGEQGQRSPSRRVTSNKVSVLPGKNALEQISEESGQSQNSTSEFHLNEGTARSKLVRGFSSELDDDDNYDERHDDDDDDDDDRGERNDARESKLGLGLRLGRGPNPEQSTWSPTLAVRAELESARQPIAGSSTPTASPNTPSNLSSPRKPFSSRTSKTELDGKKFNGSSRPAHHQSGDWSGQSPSGGGDMSPRRGTLSQELDDIATPTSSPHYSGTLEEGSSLGERDDDDDDDDSIVVLGNVGDAKLWPAPRQVYSLTAGRKL